ncbi:TetR/AcrR family transcriptional regulator [Gordonia sp. PDNC005]|uniref:TetR/AcrR family transcriptional regulator n=1 Tax=unclassified Gordonia (in: high G+C Gram-positive bacteria) TaxID=2657482 RepID=UPI00196335E7|nr:TetR/AcrR family transcriptional regulator [Gordonia sp. PDNC005]QRY63317.1 TetR/AcrR family transcriptional regulator [Gordonia sp. PDNC005]
MTLNEKPTRRRGAELEAALLDAAWEQLTERGYAGFTFEAVAERAGTSRPVLYRRWSSRTELLQATIRHHGAAEDVSAPDTGSLRGDLLAALRRSNQRRSNFLVLLSASLGEYYDESGSTPSDVRDLLLGGQRLGIDEILERAVARGDINEARLTPLVRAVPFNLYRHEVLMTLKPVPDETLEAIVDEVFLPLVCD